MLLCTDCTEPLDNDTTFVEGCGPFCSECLSEYKCRSCNNGQTRVLRDQSGRVDYIRGSFNGEWTTCTMCHGEGYLL